MIKLPPAPVGARGRRLDRCLLHTGKALGAVNLVATGVGVIGHECASSSAVTETPTLPEIVTHHIPMGTLIKP